MRRIKHIHFIGIGGAGMGGIAEVLFNQGYKVTGSDIQESAMTRHLTELGITISLDHKPENIDGADVVVVTSALREDNKELFAARTRGLPVVRRAEMLAELMRFGQGIAVSGTHGKTTTTSILASIMATAGLDPTFVIGGKLNSIGGNAKLGEGRYFIAEADESDASFLHLNPLITIVTNIDRDHMSTYGGDFQNLRKVFVNFLLRLPFYGMAVINIDDPVARDTIPELRCQVVTYGTSANADYQLNEYKQEDGLSKFKVIKKSTNEKYELTLNLPGMHNALNALAASAVCLEEGIDISFIQEALAEFKGIGRRFQVYHDMFFPNGSSNKKFIMVDDYGHHPRELAAMLQALSDGWPDKRVVMVFQPHRYTRTRDLFNEFVEVLAQIKSLVLLPVYPASELPLAGASSEDLYKAIKNSVNYEQQGNNCYIYNDSATLLENLNSIINDNDIVVIQGAGDVSQVAVKLLAANNRL